MGGGVGGGLQRTIIKETAGGKMGLEKYGGTIKTFAREAQLKGRGKKRKKHLTTVIKTVYGIIICNRGPRRYWWGGWDCTVLHEPLGHPHHVLLLLFVQV